VWVNAYPGDAHLFFNAIFDPADGVGWGNLLACLTGMPVCPSRKLP
jgi:hypothetical protein